MFGMGSIANCGGTEYLHRLTVLGMFIGTGYVSGIKRQLLYAATYDDDMNARDEELLETLSIRIVDNFNLNDLLTADTLVFNAHPDTVVHLELLAAYPSQPGVMIGHPLQSIKELLNE